MGSAEMASWEYDALCCSSSLNPEGSGSTLVGAGDGGVCRSMADSLVWFLKRSGRSRKDAKLMIPGSANGALRRLEWELAPRVLSRLSAR